jgi:GNAT superfamily N-acetyltransferase
VDLPYRLYAGDPFWRPPLRSEVAALIGSAKSNPWFEHGRAQLFLAEREGRVVGRISAHIDDLVLERRPGLGQWGLFECAPDPEVGAALIAAAEDWLRKQGMTRAQGPMSLSIWDEPGLLIGGYDTAPVVMMGHHARHLRPMVEAAAYEKAKDLHGWRLPVASGFPERINRIVAAGERNSRIRIRKVELSRFAEEARLILGILNEAWSNNWGFVPLTESEVAHVGKKLKPLVFADLIRVAEVEGEPVAFMMTLPDANEWTRDLNGSLFPVGWAKLLWRLRKGHAQYMRVPLMGVRPHLQGTRMASLLAFMMIEFTRRDALDHHGATHAEIGWILEDNGPMISIAEAIEAEIVRTYRIYEKDL